MISNAILVGRIAKNLELKYTDSGNKYTKLTLAITRNYKNHNGEYETDFISCLLFGVIAENTCEYCRQGDIVGVKGRLETRYDDVDNKYMVVVADSITYVSAGNKGE